MNASWIAPNFWLSWPAIAPALWSARLRSSNGFSVTNTMPEFELFVKPLIDRPGNATACSTPFLLHRDVAHAADHVLGAVERRAVRQLREADQVLLVLLRNEAVRHGLEDEDGRRGQHEVDGEHHRLARDRPGHAAAVGVSATLEEAIERAEESTEHEVHATRQLVFRLVMALEQQRRQRRRQRQRVDGRDHCRNRDRQRELLVD